eukprot:2199333-Amphidinium_carterae.1
MLPKDLSAHSVFYRLQGVIGAARAKEPREVLLRHKSTNRLGLYGLQSQHALAVVSVIFESVVNSLSMTSLTLYCSLCLANPSVIVVTNFNLLADRSKASKEQLHEANQQCR